MMNRVLLSTLAWCFSITLLIVPSGCREPDRVSIPQGTGAQDLTTILDGEQPTDEQRQAMRAAKDALFQELSGRLIQVMGDKGPAAAIAVCRNEARQIAEEVGEAHGLRIGRSGVRLRNPKNQPPHWAQPLTQSLTDSPQFVKLTDGRAAALLPIKLQAECLMCHGPKDQIAPVIRDQLANLYPDDQATGFRVGELRGWFWIEKPST